MNMQNIPAHTSNVSKFDYWHPIKTSFVSRYEDGLIVQFDYSAIELRVTGLVTQDREMLEIFLADGDLHTNTASMMYNKPESEITQEERQGAKKISFGLLYGETPHSFSAKNNMTVEEADELFTKYFNNKPSIKDAIESTQEFVQEYGYVESLHGHQRFLADAQSMDKKKRNEALRQSFNAKIQGLAGFFTNMALTYIDDFIQTRNMRSKLVATVHDSIVLDCPPEEVETITKVVKVIMENLPFDFLKIDYNGETIQYPIVADAEIGFNYNDAVEYDKEEVKEFNSYKGYIKYNLTKNRVNDYFESKKINEEQYKEAIKQVEEQKHLYQEI